MNVTRTSSRHLLRTLALAILAGTLSLGGCSSKRSGASSFGVASDLHGFWKLWTTEPGKLEAGPAALFIAVGGSTISGADLTGQVTGSSFEFTAPVFTGGIGTANGMITSAISAAGTYKTTNGKTVTGTFRMLKFQPTGEFTITGSVLGTPITHTSRTAIGARKYTDVARTKLFEVEVVTASAGLDFEMDIDPTNFTLGTLVAGTGPKDVVVALELSNGVVEIRPTAIGGSINVTKYDPTGLTAIFNLRLNTGDTVTGSLNVKFDIEAFLPQ